MALHDWNGNGKKDTVDDYIQYNIINSESQKNNNYNYSNDRRGISNTGATVATILDIIISAGIAGALGLEGIPLVIVFIILCAVVGAVIACFFESIGF